MRILPHLEGQTNRYQEDAVLGVDGFAHLEDWGANRALCNKAGASQVCEYDRTWKGKPIAIKKMRF